MSNAVEVKVDQQGCIIIPEELLRSLGLQEGDKLIAREESGQLVLEKRECIERRLKSMLAHIPKDRSIVDELIAERREAAKKEAKE